MSIRPLGLIPSVKWCIPVIALALLVACGDEEQGASPVTGTGEVAFVNFPKSIDPLALSQAIQVSGATGTKYTWSIRGGAILGGHDAAAIALTPKAGASYVVVNVTATDAQGHVANIVDSTPIARRVTVLDGGTYGVAIGPNNRLASMLWLDQTVRFRTGRGDAAPMDVATGSIPVHGAFSNNGQTFYVVEQDGLALRKIDTESGATTAVDYGRTMFNIAVSPVDGMVYVTTAEGWLFKSDPVTLAKLDSLYMGGASNGLAINAHGFWVSTMSGELLKVDPVTLDQLDDISLGGTPQRVAIDAAGSTAYVANEGGPGLQVVDLVSRVVTSITVDGTPYGLALSPDGEDLWVAVRDAGRVDQFNTATMSLTGSLVIGGTPRNIAFSRNGHLVLIGNQASSVLVER